MLHTECSYSSYVPLIVMEVAIKNITVLKYIRRELGVPGAELRRCKCAPAVLAQRRYSMRRKFMQPLSRVRLFCRN